MLPHGEIELAAATNLSEKVNRHITSSYTVFLADRVSVSTTQAASNKLHIMARKRMRRRRDPTTPGSQNGQGRTFQPTMIDGKVVHIRQISGTDEGVLYTHAISVSACVGSAYCLVRFIIACMSSCAHHHYLFAATESLNCRNDPKNPNAASSAVYASPTTPPTTSQHPQPPHSNPTSPPQHPNNTQSHPKSVSPPPS